MANSKDKYYTELYNTITYYNDRNNTPLSSVKILEAILKFRREDKEEAITDATNVTSDKFSLEFSPKRVNSNTIFASEMLEN